MHRNSRFFKIGMNTQYGRMSIKSYQRIFLNIKDFCSSLCSRQKRRHSEAICNMPMVMDNKLWKILLDSINDISDLLDSSNTCHVFYAKYDLICSTTEINDFLDNTFVIGNCCPICH